MSGPLRLSFEVACSTEHAFRVWTAQIGTWWPPDHTVTGRDDVVIVLEGGVGGRIFERTAEGVEHEWGHVTLWNPPTRLGYRWHLRADRENATDVEVHFVARGTATRIEIEHRGWERLGEAGDEWRERNRAGWDTLVPHFKESIAKGATS